MPNRHITGRLAARAGTRNAELTVHADNAGISLRRMIDADLSRLLSNLRQDNAGHNYRVALQILRELPERIWRTLRTKIGALVYWQHDRAAGAMVNVLPKAYLRAAGAMLMESRGMDEQVRPLLEREERTGPGVVEFGYEFPDLGPPVFTATDLTIPAGEEADWWRDLLFPPPSADVVEGMLNRILPAAETRIGNGFTSLQPFSLAAKIGQLTSSGMSTAEIGRQIRPYFDGSAMRAERTARTLGAYVGTERNFATSEALGDLVQGYQVHSAGGENARHTHAMRSGTIYYREPTGGQYGFDVMPHPPIDTGRGPYDETKPRVNGGVMCYNCRCWTSPVLAPLPAMRTPAFTDNAHKLIPDVAHFSDWFDTADIRQRRAAAGAKRLAIAKEILGREPTWADIVDAKTGNLLSLERLKEETAAQRLKRLVVAQEQIRKNRAQIKRVAAFGTA